MIKIIEATESDLYGRTSIILGTDFKISQNATICSNSIFYLLAFVLLSTNTISKINMEQDMEIHGRQPRMNRMDQTRALTN
jgi:hypothetical protein